MFKRILVPLDGSQLAEMVLSAARYFASKFQATIVLFHVVEKNAPDSIHGHHHLQNVTDATTYLEQISQRLMAKGVKVEQDVHEVQESGVAQTIRDHAHELDTDLVILCAHGDGGLRDKVFGSIAQQVIRQGSIPVLYLRPEGKCCSETDVFRHILLPLDGAKNHEDAIPAAVEIAAKTEATIHLLTVVPTAETLPIKSALMSRVSPRTSRLALENSAQQAEAYLQDKAMEISSRGVQASTSMLRGDISARVNEIIAAKNINLVVIATHGHSTLDARWEGSLTPGFLPNTPVPVLLVRGSEDKS